jgi:hypothetical protein
MLNINSMSSLQHTLDTTSGIVIRHIDEIIDYFRKNIEIRSGYEYTTWLGGFVTFGKASARYEFDDVQGLKDAVLEQDANDIYELYFSLRIEEHLNINVYQKNTVANVTFSLDPRRGLRVAIKDRSFILARKQIDVVASILENASYVRVEDKEEDRDIAVKNITAILDNLPDYQARIRQSFANERDVQDFLFPILKSHFPTLQEEDYLSKVAGTASKPDFGIENLGIAIEVKVTSRNKSFKQLQVEINDDSRKYFGKSSPFKTMIVLIYNASSEPTPANYVSDLEHMDVISKVVVSPSIIPREK